MKMVKSLLLGTAAGLVAMTGAQAADLPVKAKPVQYVKICSLYGAGFYYMPGTDTCIKIGGFMRTELNFNAGGSFSVVRGNLDDPTRNDVLWRSRAVLTADARSQTEYGTLRSYATFGVQWDNGAGSGVQANAAGAFGATSFNNSLNIYRGFIQWAGFTAGRAVSFFDVYNTPAYSNTVNVLGSDTGGTGINLLGYTAQFGNGFSATIAVEDSAHRRATGGQGNFNPNVGIANTTYAGVSWPDVVANLRIDQSWGSAQVMGAIHNVNAINPVPSSDTIDEIGWAVGAGMTINLPMIGAGDNFSIQATYAEGAMHYVGSGLNTGMSASKGFPTNTEAAFAPNFDAVLTPGNNLELTTGWSVVAGFKHVWNPRWNTTLYGTYGQIDYSALASANIAVGACGGSADCSWTMWQIGSRTTWTPVTNLDLSVDIMYNQVNGADGPVTGAGGAVLTDTKVGWLQGMVRAQRNFYP